MKKKFLLSLFIVINVIILCGCISGGSQDLGTTQNIVKAATPNSTKAAMSNQPTPAKLIKTITPTRKPTKTLTPTNTYPITWTPLATYSSDEAIEKLKELYTSDICDLPCWWGITPGKTEWRDAWQILGRMALNDPRQIQLIDSDIPGYKSMFIEFPISEVIYSEDVNIEDAMFVHVNSQTFTVDHIEINTGSLQKYSIYELFEKYGEPERIIAYGGPHAVSDYAGVELFLIYPESGFVSWQFANADNDKWEEESFTACFQQSSWLYLWEKGLRLSDDEFEDFFSLDFKTHTISISDVTDYSLDEFYSKVITEKENCYKFYTKPMLPEE